MKNSILSILFSLFFGVVAFASPILEESSLLFYPTNETTLHRNYVPHNLVFLEDYGIPLDSSKRGRQEGKVREIIIPSLQQLIISCPNILVRSGYRSYEKQWIVYKKIGAPYAAQPGVSEHQLGLAVDFISQKNHGWETLVGNPLEPSDETCLEKHAEEHGFIQSFPHGHPNIAQESWHYRFVGQEAIEAMKGAKMLDTPWEFFQNPFSKEYFAQKEFMEVYGQRELISLRKEFFGTQGAARLELLRTLYRREGILKASLFMETLGGNI